MEWTKEQKRIIDLRNSNILVSAAAGSGKTAVLVERIINLVKNENEDIDKFLVVTFTNAAAAGMKQKIQKALVQAVHEGKNQKHIRKQLNLLNKANITTIHSFCLDVVKKNFHIIGLDPSFRIGDSSELSILFQESIDEVLERAYTKETESFKILVEGFTGNRGDLELYEIIGRVYKFLLSFPDPFKWLENSVNRLSMIEEEFKSSLWYKEILNYVQMQVEGAKGIVELALKISTEEDGPKVYEKTLQEDLLILDEINSSLEKELVEAINEIHNFKAPRISSFKADDPKNINVNIEKQKEVKDILREEYKKIIASLKELLPYKSLSEYVEDINFMYEAMEALKELIIDLDKIYKGKKLEKSIVDFNDLEHYALSILRKPIISEDSSVRYIPSDIGVSYKNKFNYIFIDEYQDSNSIQETIIEQIKRDNNLFMVGDVKQSIYRFRLADPSIFNSKYRAYTKDREDLDDNIINRVVELNKNFRSREEILEGTNYIFKNIMSEDLGEIDYNENVFLKCGNKEFSTNNPVELNIIEKSSISSKDKLEQLDDINDELESMKTAEIEALFAVKKIKELLNEEIYDGNNEKKLRKIEYKDIVILLRSVSDWSNIFEEVFNKEEIPFYFDGGAGYFNTIEIQIMINLLKLIDNIRQDIPLISVMRSPIGKFTTEELVKIRSKYTKGSYIDACIECIDTNHEVSNDENFSPELIGKLDGFFKMINDWVDRSKYTDLNDLIWEILMETNYYHFVGTLPKGKIRQANLRLLVDKAYEFEKTSMKGLFKFLRYIEKLNSNGNDSSSIAKTLGENDNVVRLMTVHNSKGLEFPVVILCGLNKGFNLQDTRSKILMHKEYGLAPKYINIEKRIEKDTIGRIAIAKKIKFENLSEEMRILYVAMTRAIDRLIMVGTVNKINDSIKIWRKGHLKYFLYKGKSYMDWIGSCLFEDMDLEAINEIFVKGQHEKWKVNKILVTELLQDRKTYSNVVNTEKLNNIEDSIDRKSYEEIDRRLSYKYPYENAVNIPAKLAVTKLKNINIEKLASLKYDIPTLSNILEFDKESKKIIVDKQELKGSEIGTLIHFIMQHIDVSGKLDRNDLIQQIEQITSKNFITDSEANFIFNNYLDKIEGFYNSNIGLRMRKSPVIKREVPFVIKKKADEILKNLNGNDFILVQGIIDCYFEEDDEVVIIDYKTDNINENQIEKLIIEYKDQITSYKEAIEKIKKKKVKESYLYLFSLGTEVPIR